MNRCPECGKAPVFRRGHGEVECPNGHVWVLIRKGR